MAVWCQVVLLPAVLLAGCGSDTVAPEDFEIVGTWDLSELEGASGNYDSQWTLAADGSYTWTFFSDVLGFDLDGSGTYTMEGSVLSVTGIVANTVISTFAVKQLTLTLMANSFSFQDDEGDRWTYTRR